LETCPTRRADESSVSAVPALVIGRRVPSGLQDRATLGRVLDEGLRRRGKVPPPAGPQ